MPPAGSRRRAGDRSARRVRRDPGKRTLHPRDAGRATLRDSARLRVSRRPARVQEAPPNYSPQGPGRGGRGAGGRPAGIKSGAGRRRPRRGRRTRRLGSMASRKKNLQGLVAATITPMTEHGEINLSVIGQYVDYLVEKQGVKNIFVNGTTGEGLSLSISERRRVAEEWVTKGRNKLDQVVIHVGALSLKESQELAKHAAEIGADGIAVIAPFFLKPQNKDDLTAFLKEVAAAAPALPFYYYHIPALTGVKIRAEELLDGIQEKIPTFQGLKFSDTDLLDFGQCVDQNRQRQFAFLFGVDEQLLSALVMGATGAVGSTYNYLGKKTNQMLEAYERKDFSSALNYQIFLWL
ncbi:N-acetylneuraminate lyase isoform X4 [Myotis daubentonii]|uniref:N-acetylneuraminate lyase isoform X4 n=1 Tax=Myotis daubentonii TaxID=98922 RepID=UPI002872FB38|nr:N-acetylneuraminate lyase isoform X4 [Myotis daubentonii]